MPKLLLCVLVSAYCVTISTAKKCKVDHTWRPFYGDIPEDAFIAGYGHSGRPIYVLQVTPPDDYIWSVPMEYIEGQRIRFGWHQVDEVVDITIFMKILCYDVGTSLEWVKIHDRGTEVANKCCLVEGGFGKFARDDKLYVARIGRFINSEGLAQIGRTYDQYYVGLHLGIARNASKVMNDYEVLAYGCHKKNSNSNTIN